MKLIKRMRNRRLEDHLRLESDIVQREMADIVLVMFEAGIVLKADANEYNMNGWYPLDAVKLAENTVFELEMLEKLEQYYSVGSKLLDFA